MKSLIKIFVLFFLFLNCAKAQPGDWARDEIQNSYPLCIKQNNTSDTNKTIAIRQYTYDLLEKRITYYFVLEASPELYIPAPTSNYTHIRFRLPNNGSKPDALVIYNNKNDSMVVNISVEEFYRNKGFIDTISFVPGTFNLSELKEIKNNRVTFYTSIASSEFRAYKPNCMWACDQTRYFFISENRLVYYPQYNYPFLGAHKREINQPFFDTISYSISGDTIYLSSSFSKDFLSDKEAWIQPMNMWLLGSGGYSVTWYKNKRQWKKWEKKIQKQNDTVHVIGEVEPLLWKQIENSKMSIYLNDSLFYYGKATQKIDEKIIRKHQDSIVVKIGFDYTCNGENKFIENLFPMKGWGTIYVTIGIGYKQEYLECPNDYFIIRNNLLYATEQKKFPSNTDFYLKHGILVYENAFKQQ